MKLYRVKVRTSHAKYRESYVVATNPQEAYLMVRKFLDDNDFLFNDERVLDSIELIAEKTLYPDCKVHLFY